MIQYTPVNQLTIEEFKTPFEVTLSSENRRVKLAEIVNWDVFSQQYIKMMNQGFGRPEISPRIVLGAFFSTPYSAYSEIDNFYMDKARSPFC